MCGGSTEALIPPVDSDVNRNVKRDWIMGLVKCASMTNIAIGLCKTCNKMKTGLKGYQGCQAFQ